MKHMLGVLLLVTSAYAFAFPNVGDFVQYEAHYKEGTLIHKKKIISYDQVRDSFQVGEIVTFKGEILEQVVHDTKRSWLYSDKQVEDVLKGCRQREGSLTDMEIDHKIVSVCEFYDEPSQLSYMIGMVPFAAVRFQRFISTTEYLYFYLTKFEMGKP